MTKRGYGRLQAHSGIESSHAVLRQVYIESATFQAGHRASLLVKDRIKRSSATNRNGEQITPISLVPAKSLVWAHRVV